MKIDNEIVPDHMIGSMELKQKMNEALFDEHYEVTAITKLGEEKQRTKINQTKRHSPGNTIIGFNIYKNGVLEKTIYK